MQNVKPLLLVLLTYSLLSCETTKPVSTTSELGNTRKCGGILVGVTTEKRKLEVAGTTLMDFSLGKVQTEVTPEFQRIASEAAMNEDSRVKIACTAMEMSGVKASPEMFTYYLHLLGFLSSTPSPSMEKRMEWAEKFPVPKTPQPPESNSPNTGTNGSAKATQESLSTYLVRTCKQPPVGLNRRPEYFVPYWFEYLHKLKEEKFPAGRDLQSLYYIKGRYRDHLYTPEDVFSESLYTLKCLEEMGEVKLEKLGTTGKYQEKAFENQRIVFQ